jgi:hypothetical protein
MKTGFMNATRKDRLEKVAARGLRLDGDQAARAWRGLMEGMIELSGPDGARLPKFNDPKSLPNDLTSFYNYGISPIWRSRPSAPALATRCGVWMRLCQLCRLSGLELLLRGFSFSLLIPNGNLTTVDVHALSLRNSVIVEFNAPRKLADFLAQLRTVASKGQSRNETGYTVEFHIYSFSFDFGLYVHLVWCGLRFGLLWGVSWPDVCDLQPVFLDAAKAADFGKPLFKIFRRLYPFRGLVPFNESFGECGRFVFSRAGVGVDAIGFARFHFDFGLCVDFVSCVLGHVLFPHFRYVFVSNAQVFCDFARASRPVNFLPVVLLAWPHGAFRDSPPHQLHVFHESAGILRNLAVGLSPVDFWPIHGRGLRPVDSKPDGGPTAGADNVAHCSAQGFKFSSSLSPGGHVARHDISIHRRIHVGAGWVTIPPEELSSLVTVCGCGFERCAVCPRDNIAVEAIAPGSHGLSDCLRECLGLGELGHSFFAGDNVVRFHLVLCGLQFWLGRIIRFITRCHRRHIVRSKLAIIASSKSIRDLVTGFAGSRDPVNHPSIVDNVGGVGLRLRCPIHFDFVRFHAPTIRQPLAAYNNYFANRAYFFCMLGRHHWESCDA